VQLLTGCVLHESYNDQSLPESELAIVEGYWHYRFIYDEEIQIVSVDGQSHEDDALFYAHSVSLPAGRHWLQLAILRNGREIDRCAFEWEFEKQAQYKIQSLEHDQTLLAHPLFSTFPASLIFEVTSVSGSAQNLEVPAECGVDAMCRQGSECKTGYSCQSHSGFEFGTCSTDDH